MSPEYRPERRRLTVGRETRSLEIGAEIDTGEPSIKLTVSGKEDDGTLIVEEYNSIDKKFNFRGAPLQVGTPITILDRTKITSS